jgi:hypothetical protein
VRPRHLVVFFMRGGLDAVLTTAPKSANAVDEHVDIGYSRDELFSVGNHQFGPHLRPVERHLSTAAIINGVYAGTLQHAFGAAQLLRMKTRVGFDVPTIGEVIGHHVRQHPIPAIAFGKVETTVGIHPAGLLSCTAKGKFLSSGHDLCDDIVAMTPGELQLAADGLDHLAKGADRAPEVVASAREIAALMRRLASGIPKPSTEQWLPETEEADRNPAFDQPKNGLFQRDCQRALWALEHELATSVIVQPQAMDWDTHTDNLTGQRQNSTAFFSVFARFLDELAVRRNAHGTLASQTVVVVASEMGRLPRLNDQRGKDHFPELPVLMWGPRLRVGRSGLVAGAVGRRMESLPVDLATGLPSATGAIPTLDDIGASVFAAFGIEARQYGYMGRALPFLVEV